MLFESHSLCRTFLRGDSKVRALSNVSVRIDQGEYVAISGPSGCGKTTMLSIFGLLDPGYAGSFRFRGYDATRLSDSECARLRLSEIGFVFQNFHLLPALNVLDNVALPNWRLNGNRRQARAKATELLGALRLGHRLNHDVRRLSGGEMQRVALARALVNDPKVILADEPTANLDADSTTTILRFFSRLCDEGKTLVVVSHDPAVVDSAKRVITLRYGQIASDWSAASPPMPLRLVG